MTTKKIALITGAGKLNGLGYRTGLALLEKGYEVVFSSRNTKAIQKEAKAGLQFMDIDVTDDHSVQQASKIFETQYGKLDVLINNAGVYQISENKNDHSSESVLTAKPKELLQIFDINTVGAFRMTQAFMKLLLKSDSPRIVNISSGMGGLTEMEAGYPAYRLSKVAINALTCFTQAEMKETKLKVNSVCPGWVRTEMGGEGAERSLEEGISGIVWAATLDAKGPSGGFFRDGEKLDW